MTEKSDKINLQELGISSIDKTPKEVYKPEKDIKELRSQFEESSLKYSIDTLSRYNDNMKS